MSPNADITFQDTHCGNSLVEDGEDCDCDFLNLCTKDPCCQSNYTLSPGAPCTFGSVAKTTRSCHQVTCVDNREMNVTFQSGAMGKPTSVQKTCI